MVNNYLALDVGTKRVGLAMSRHDVRVPVMLATLDRESADLWDKLKSIIAQNEIGTVVVGLPRGLDGRHTSQTKYAEDFAQELSTHTGLDVNFQDEALTSVTAKEILDREGKPYSKADVDSMSASLILVDFLEQPGARL